MESVAEELPSAAETDPRQFRFMTQRMLVAFTGRRARSLPDLLHHLGKVPDSSIFFHTHAQYLMHHFEKPLVYNDLAEWVSHALQEKALAERMAAINLLQFTNISEIRSNLIEHVQSHLREAGLRLRESSTGDEFHFLRAKTFVIPTGFTASDVGQFAAAVPKLSNASLYFHFFEARLRLGHHTNDFSYWLRTNGNEELAAAIERLNPYDYTLEELRGEIARLAGGEAQPWGAQ